MQDCLDGRDTVRSRRLRSAELALRRKFAHVCHAGERRQATPSRRQDPAVSCRGHGVGNRFGIFPGIGPKSQRGTSNLWRLDNGDIPETRRLRALGFWLNGTFLEDYEFSIEGTPCQPVIETKSRAHFPERLLDLFPHDAGLAALGAVSFMGIPLLDADGTLLGALGVLGNRPMPAEPQLYELFDLFAVRAVAEMRRLRAESAMREREAQLSLLLDTAMDAILALDGEFRITRLNPRATELFACTEEDLAGRKLSRFSRSGRRCEILEARQGNFKPVQV